MKMSLSEIAALVGGEVHGDGGKLIEGAAGLDEATEKEISFLANAKYTDRLATTKAGALLVSPDVPLNGRAAVVLKNPHFGWAKVLEVLEKERLRHPAGIHPTAVVAVSAKIGKNVAIGAHAVGSGRRHAPLGKAAWRSLEARYEAHRRPDGLLPATYDLVLLHLEKPR